MIWDEDHDLRIITAIERLHSQSLLTHALFIGERKGTFTLLVDGSYYGRITDYRKDLLRRQVARQVASIGGDHWQVAIGSFSPVGINDETIMESIIDADDSKIEAYLRRIGVKWCLGTKLAHDLAYMDEAWSESERSPRLDPSKDSVPNWMTLEHD